MCDRGRSEEGGVLDSMYNLKVGECREDESGDYRFYGELGRPVS